MCEHRREASAVMAVQLLSYEFLMVVGVCYTYEYMYIRVMGWNIFPMILMKLYLCIDHTEIALNIRVLQCIIHCTSTSLSIYYRNYHGASVLLDLNGNN